jgi:hypothetical protein
VSDKTGWEGRGQQFWNLGWAMRTLCRAWGPAPKGKWCAGFPEGVYSVGLLGAKTEIPATEARPSCALAGRQSAPSLQQRRQWQAAFIFFPRCLLLKTLYQPVPRAPDFPSIARKILRFWEDGRIFEKLRKQTTNGPRWSFLDGPITANNPMGDHHAWGRSLKDMYQRYHPMIGKALRYQNGFDIR